MVPSYIMLKNFAVMCVTCSKIYACCRGVESLTSRINVYTVLPT